MRRKKDRKFEEKYFTEWYKGAVGSFTQEDLELSRKWFWAWLHKLGKYIPISHGKKKNVLEIGCSIGGVASLLAERGFTVYASDISEYAVKNAKKLSPEVNFFTLDIEKKPNLKKKFEFIISFEVVEHIQHPERAIKNMYDLLKPGGYIAISTPYPYAWAYADPTHISVKYPEEWVAIMKSVGFKNVKYHRFSLLPYFYKIHRRFQIIFPFPIPLPFINNPIFFIGKK